MSEKESYALYGESLRPLRLLPEPYTAVTSGLCCDVQKFVGGISKSLCGDQTRWIGDAADANQRD